MGSKHRAVALIVAIVGVLAAAFPAGASALKPFRPRIGGAFGLMPLHGQQEIATGTNYPVVYHGGSVMRDVTIHTVFWAPAGYRFEGSPGPGVLSYQQLVQQFFTDVAHDSGTQGNIYSALDEYGDRSGPGSYRMAYSPGTDSIDDGDAYPGKRAQCASPSGVATCVTDLEIQKELDRMISAHDPSGRGLHDLWFAFLPPDVDTCSSPGVCGTTEFAGYHSLSDLGHGPVIYALIPEPTIEFTPSPGSDPEGNPDAESTLDTIAHETFEAITNPEGDGWMDSNGFEAADKCENGPEEGQPLGFASDGSPYNNVIDGHEYLIQTIWSNASAGCVQRSSATSPAPSLPTVDETQFSRLVSGNLETKQAGVSVFLRLMRAGTEVSSAMAHTRADGAWGPVRLSHAVGDDRDELDVSYPLDDPLPDVIQTGDGGNPFTESGWTGWFDLDHGYAVSKRGVLLSPCSQTGALTLTVGHAATTPPPIELCETETGVSVIPTSPISAGTSLSMSSEDNRAVTYLNPVGALVKLTVPLGEPRSVSALANDQVLIEPSGFPSCTANLEAQTVSCNGLVPRAHYRLTRGHRAQTARADRSGVALFVRAGVRGGEVVKLVDPAGRRLTSLHVAHLRVALDGDQTVIASGRCQPGDYYGPPITSPPTSSQIGEGVSGSGRICPLSGRARGLPSPDIEQTDDRGGGLTRTFVPDFESISPNSGATLYGGFVAQAQVGLLGSTDGVYAAHASVALTIYRASSRRRIRFVPNVAGARGVRVPHLAAGVYDAKWVLRDRNGDTRTIHTRFVEAG